MVCAAGRTCGGVHPHGLTRDGSKDGLRMAERGQSYGVINDTIITAVRSWAACSVERGQHRVRRAKALSGVPRVLCTAPPRIRQAERRLQAAAKHTRAAVQAQGACVPAGWLGLQCIAISPFERSLGHGPGWEPSAPLHSPASAPQCAACCTTALVNSPSAAFMMRRMRCCELCPPAAAVAMATCCSPSSALERETHKYCAWLCVTAPHC